VALDIVDYYDIQNYFWLLTYNFSLALGFRFLWLLHCCY